MTNIFKLVHLVVLASGFVQSSLAAGSLCVPGEFIYFSCRVANKTISLCGSKDLGENSGYLQYRYGTTSKVDLTFPSQRVRPSGVFEKDFQVWSHGGYESTVGFTLGEHRYVVYSALQLGSTESMNNDRTGSYGPKAGVRVYRREDLVRDIKCQGEGASENDPRYFDSALPAFLRPKG